MFNYAFAQSSTQQPSMLASFVPLILIFLIFYFLLIRPQQKKQKEHTRMVSSLKKGDKVVTNGGIFGTISKVGEDRITLEVASKLNIQIERHQVARIDQNSIVKEEVKDTKKK